MTRGCRDVVRPIFLVGTGRCGSTILFEALAVHEALGWLSSYNARFPAWRLASVAPRVYDMPVALPRSERRQARQGLSRLNRLLPKPAETYTLWERTCGRKFVRTYLVGEEATPAERTAVRRELGRLLWLQGKSRFATKITGPTRIEFLQSIFPDLQVIHVIRDGRAVVNSWLEVDFWKCGGGYIKPFWEGGLPAGWEAIWALHGRTPAALAAIQYRAIIENARREARLLQPRQYTEVRYESFISSPSDTVTRILDFVDLPPSKRLSAYLRAASRYVDMNNKFRTGLAPSDLATIDSILAGFDAPQR